ncbi:MAG: phosphatase domain-containing protein [Verrucomicrobiota bacterium]
MNHFLVPTGKVAHFVVVPGKIDLRLPHLSLMSAPEKGPHPRQNWLRWIFLQLEKGYDAVHRFLAWITGRLGKPMTAEIFFVTPIKSGLEIKGRVLLARTWREPDPADSRARNFLQMMKRWATPERPFSLVRVSSGDDSVESRADNEGYFEALLPSRNEIPESIKVSFPESEVSPSFDHEVCKVDPDHSLLIVSDIDDTVLITHAARTLRMIATTLFGNAMTRQLFPGTADLYQALRTGPKPESPTKNPILYVTSSPYNLHSLLKLIFERNGLPVGPFFMTDWGLDADKWFKKSHRDHKLGAIGEALNWYPAVPVLLIGDSGQHDTMIYVEIAKRFPDRIKQILIRDVTGEERRNYLETHVAELESFSTEISFFQDSAEAAEILTKQGWISEQQRMKVAASLEVTRPSFQDAESH